MATVGGDARWPEVTVWLKAGEPDVSEPPSGSKVRVYEDESLVCGDLALGELFLIGLSVFFSLNGRMDLKGEGLLLASGDGVAVGAAAPACASPPVLSNGLTLLYGLGEGVSVVGEGAVSPVVAYAPVDAPISASPTMAVSVISLRMP